MKIRELQKKCNARLTILNLRLNVCKILFKINRLIVGIVIFVAMGTGRPPIGRPCRWRGKEWTSCSKPSMRRRRRRATRSKWSIYTESSTRKIFNGLLTSLGMDANRIKVKTKRNTIITRRLYSELNPNSGESHFNPYRTIIQESEDLAKAALDALLANEENNYLEKHIADFRF